MTDLPSPGLLLQIATNARAGPEARSQEPDVLSGSPKWVAGDQTLELPSFSFPRPLASSWIGSRVAGIRTGIPAF